MNSSGNITNGIGQPVRRKEDFRLLTGRGSFADDVRLPEMARAVIVRGLGPLRAGRVANSRGGGDERVTPDGTIAGI